MSGTSGTARKPSGAISTEDRRPDGGRRRGAGRRPRGDGADVRQARPAALHPGRPAPPPYLEALSPACRTTSSRSGSTTVEEIVEAELGARMSKGSASFDHRPAGLGLARPGPSGRAPRRPTGGGQGAAPGHPGAGRRRTWRSSRRWPALADGHTETGRRFGFADMVAEFRASLLAELDYRQEAANLQAPRREPGRPPTGSSCPSRSTTTRPRPCSRWTTSTGATSHRSARSARWSVDGAGRWPSELFRAYLDQILVHGFVHADPHPGNVLVTDDGRLALIDLGMVARRRADHAGPARPAAPRGQ